MPPGIFFLSHFPDESAFRLTDKKLTEAGFYEQAFCLWEFGESGINATSHRNLLITGEPGDIVEIWFNSEKEISHVISK